MNSQEEQPGMRSVQLACHPHVQPDAIGQRPRNSLRLAQTGLTFKCQWNSAPRCRAAAALFCGRGRCRPYAHKKHIKSIITDNNVKNTLQSQELMIAKIVCLTDKLLPDGWSNIDHLHHKVFQEYFLYRRYQWFSAQLDNKQVFGVNSAKRDLKYLNKLKQNSRRKIYLVDSKYILGGLSFYILKL